jgi:hypothetical protein
MRSVLAKPSVTPVTAFWSRERVSHRLVLRRVRGPRQHDASVLFLDLDAAANGHRQLALRAFDPDLTPGGVYLYLIRHLDRRLTDSRHSFSFLLIDEAENLAAEAGPAGLVVGEDATRG